MPCRGCGFRFGAYPNLHDLLGCIPSCLHDFLIPAPAQLPSTPSAKSSEFLLFLPPPVFPELQILVVCGLAILAGLGKAVNRPSNVINQIRNLGPSQFSAWYIKKRFWIFWQTAAATSVCRSISQRHLTAISPQNLHFVEPPTSTV